MALDGIVKELWDKTDAITKPDADFEAVRDKVAAAASAIREHYTKGPVTGLASIDRFEEFSKIYFEATGIKEDSNALYGQRMRRILGSNYDDFLKLLKTGKDDEIDKALSLAKDAYAGDNLRAEIGAVVDRVVELTQGEMVLWATQAVEKIGGIDYGKVLRNIPQYMQHLLQFKGLDQQKKEISQIYIPSAPTPA